MLTETLHTAFFDPAPKERTQKMPAGPIAGETALFGRKLCEEFAPRNEGIRLSEERGSKPAGRAAGEIALSGRKLCEEFAPRNEGIRPSGGWGANRAARSPAKLHFPAGSCVKNLLPGTKT